jgi:uncharacterized protein YbjT (DUF2867 family)
LENFLQPRLPYIFPEVLSTGELRTLVLPETKVAVIAVRDIASFAVAAFENPEKFNGKRIELASDLITYPEFVDIITKETVHQVKYVYESREEALKNDKVTALLQAGEWANEVGFQGTMDTVRSYGVPLTRVDQFVRENKDKFGLLHKSNLLKQNHIISLYIS